MQIKRVEKIREVFDLDIDPAALLQQYAGKNPFPSIVHHIMDQYKDKEEFADYQPGGRRLSLIHILSVFPSSKGTYEHSDRKGHKK